MSGLDYCEVSSTFTFNERNKSKYSNPLAKNFQPIYLLSIYLLEKNLLQTIKKNNK